MWLIVCFRPQQQVQISSSTLQFHSRASAVENIYQIDGSEYELCPWSINTTNWYQVWAVWRTWNSTRLRVPESFAARKTSNQSASRHVMWWWTWETETCLMCLICFKCLMCLTCLIPSNYYLKIINDLLLILFCLFSIFCVKHESKHYVSIW